ncbi:phage baseplate assembly protein V [Escherichia coli]|uniref:phage baseplate assembly protein V n=1 Tax=Escherichia coli TaxID=562 RepID=UPI0010AC24E6|nr:phage baseplate assembly protein V [Escherichia coli]EHL6538958.1 phage baseplate assembly protein V [Escherichia coli]TJE92239.1 phage baseplate assembly protein V [Escherichia coli]
MNIELMRLLHNIVRIGVVTEINTDTWEVRVQSGGLTTNWIRWNCGRAGKFKIWIPPSPGEQVLLLCPGGTPETAVSAGSLYSKGNPPPGSLENEMVISAPDGAEFRYDAGKSELTAMGIKTARIIAETKITLDTPSVECTQHLKAKTFELTEGGKMTGNITHTGGSLTSNGITVHKHVHSGVRSGGDTSGGPQ